MSIAGLIDELAAQGVELWFEGPRLRFRAPAGALRPEQRARLGAERDEAIALLRERAAAQTRVAPLSYGQRSLWLVHQEAPDSAAYNVAFAARIDTTIDRFALEATAQALVDRHAILRTTYVLVDGRPCQHVAGTGQATVEWNNDLRGASDEQLHERVAADYRRPFDLARGPLWRVSVFTRGDNDHVLLINAHHIALDGWSLLLLLDEWRRLHAEFRGGAQAALPRPQITYVDYVQWQAGMLAGPEGAKLAAYWQDKLAAPRTELELPADRARPARKSTRGATLDFTFDDELSPALQQLARDEGTTLFVLMLAAFNVLLHRCTGAEDIVVGTPTLGRQQGTYERVLGHFVNPVPLRTRVAADLSFRELTARVRQTLLEALETQEYPLALMVERLHPVRDPSRSPLFETIFVLQRFEQFSELNELISGGPQARATDLGGLPVRPYPIAQQEGQFDLSLGLVDSGGSLRGAFKYNCDLFDEATVRRLAEHYTELLRHVVADPTVGVARVRLLGTAEREALLAAASGGFTAPEASTLHAGFEAQVARAPDAPALSFETTTLSYAELNRCANRLAHRLRELGVGAGVLVGLYAERSPELVVGVLGILKAGGAYVPIDLSYPRDRVAYMVEDARAGVIVTQRDLLPRLAAPGAALVCLDDPALAAMPDSDPPAAAGPDDLAYVIYTSGSTGRPKGTLLTHRAVDRLFRATDAWFGFGPDDVWTLFHSIAFDFSVWELWGALRHGGRLVVVPFWVSRSPEGFLELLRSEQVTVLNQTPSAFRQLVQADLAGGPARQTSLRHIVFGGEKLELQSLRPWIERHGDARPRLVNMYGITETCVHVSYRPITLADLDAGRGSVIGVPIPDLRVHVLDGLCEPVPLGVVGEMYVGGPGLARGYLNRPELTAERFIDDPFQPGERLYRTGDLARRLADGDLEYVGRIDHQVKVRGFRIELGEIEAALANHPSVSEAVVVARGERGESRELVAYVVPSPSQPPTPAVLREHLRAELPEYMVPGSYVLIQSMPLTSNNKIDVAALPPPDAAGKTRSSGDDEPRTTLEFQLLALWRQVLGNDLLGTHDNFFDHGGHSLMAVELLSRVEQVYGRKLPLATLFQAPAVAQLAELLDRSDWQASWRSLVAINPGGSATPMFLVPGVGGNVLMFGKLSKLLGSDQPVYGLQARGLDGKEEPFRSIPEMAEHYVAEIRSARPHGPYFIGGTCTGGVVAYDIAQRLAAGGEEVRLVLLETWPPATARTRRWPGRVLWPLQYLALKLVGYLGEMARMPVRKWPGFVRAKLRTGRAVFDIGLKETLEGSTYYVEKVVDATIQAVARYEPRPYPGSLLNVIAIERPLPSKAVDTRRSWERLAQGPAEAVMVAAEDSGRLFMPPHVATVADILRAHALGLPASSAAAGTAASTGNTDAAAPPQTRHA